ncbi:MAG: hypothetical protein GXO70_08560 [Acidobacteria bacterium]|nr:hypothetical protein [Acidobacteriota bacterium]
MKKSDSVALKLNQQFLNEDKVAQAQFSIQLNVTPNYKMVQFFRDRLWFKALPNPEIEDFCVFKQILP